MVTAPLHCGSAPRRCAAPTHPFGRWRRDDLASTLRHGDGFTASPARADEPDVKPARPAGLIEKISGMSPDHLARCACRVRPRER